MFRAGVCVAILSLAISASNAATIAVVPTDDVDFSLIAIQGELLFDDFKEFQNKAALLSKAGVIFQSPGGNVLAALQIGRFIRLHNFATLVPDNMTCASACALAWLGGTHRFMGAMARIGFHAAFDKSGRETGMGNALVGAYLNEIGLPYSAVIYITKAAPASMTWMTPGDAKQVGIDVAVFRPSPKTSAPARRDPIPLDPSTTEQGRAAPVPTSPTTRRTTAFDLQRRSREFVIAWYQKVSRARGGAVLASFYNDPVRYYDKLLSREQAMAQIETFLTRWPIRDYEPIEETMSVNCSEDSFVCVVKGAIQFDARSRERDRHSWGRATFEYWLRFPSQDQPPKIVVETGKVLERNSAALSSENEGDLWSRLRRQFRTTD
jgi:hypothetical protein